MRRMRRPDREIEEERLLGIGGYLAANILDRVIDQVVGQVIVRVDGETIAYCPARAAADTDRYSPPESRNSGRSRAEAAIGRKVQRRMSQPAAPSATCRPQRYCKPADRKTSARSPPRGRMGYFAGWFGKPFVTSATFPCDRMAVSTGQQARRERGNRSPRVEVVVAQSGFGRQPIQGWAWIFQTELLNRKSRCHPARL